MNLPEKFEDKMRRLLQEEFPAYEKSLDRTAFSGLRVNTLKISTEEFLEKNLFPLRPVKWCPEGFYYDPQNRPSKHPYYYAGLYYLQEPSAMAPGAVLDIEPGDRVLDLCAAPGGKATYAGAKLKQKGVLVANDISPSRCKALLKNIEVFGIRNGVVTSERAERLAERFAGYFDKILIDAPCSGEGMFRKDVNVMKNWSEKLVETCLKQQASLLEQAAKMLAPGGLILYSTCTFEEEENEGSIRRFLENHKEFTIEPISSDFGFSPGLGQPQEPVYGCARLWPHRLEGEGHFLALLRNTQPKEGRLPFPKVRSKQREKELEPFFTFYHQYCDFPLDGVLRIIQNSLYLQPEELPDLDGLRVIRGGFYLGELKKGRFEPSQSLAMGLEKGQFRDTVDLTVEDPAVIRYLKGETLEGDYTDGWKLVQADGFPLGWAKAQNGRLKNKYHAGWRWE